MENLDIKNFTLQQQVSNDDRILMAEAANDHSASAMTVGKFKELVINPLLTGGGTGNNTLNLSGLKISILGDGISSYQGLVPAGYPVHYPQGDVDSADKTWWQMIAEHTGATIEVNNSYHESSVAGTTDTIMCSDARIANLGNPDIIIVLAGMEDFRNPGIVLGNTVDVDDLSDINRNQFIPAYQRMLTRLMTVYEKAKIFLCTPTQPCVYGENNSTSFPQKNGSEYFHQYATAIRQLSDIYGLPLIDLAKCGINYYSSNESPWNVGATLRMGTIDGIYPNYQGMVWIAGRVLCALKSAYCLDIRLPYPEPVPVPEPEVEIITEADATIPGYIRTSGEIVPYSEKSNYRHTKVYEIPNDAVQVVYHGYVGPSNLGVAFYDEDMNFILPGITNTIHSGADIAVPSQWPWSGFPVDIPNNAKYACFAYAFLTGKPEACILRAKWVTANEKAQATDLIIDDTNEASFANGWLRHQGDVYTTGGYKTTGYVDISRYPAGSILCMYGMGNQNPVAGFYDSNRKFLPNSYKLGLYQGYYHTQILVPEGATYARFSYTPTAGVKFRVEGNRPFEI